jgi:serine/threonine protein phosphatase PrpC
MPGSPVASEAAVAAVVQWARERRVAGVGDVPGLIASVKKAVAEALQARGEPGATTLACAILYNGGGIVATVGDSEALAVGPTGPAQRLNELDHLPARPNMLLAWIDAEQEPEPHVIELDTLPYRLCLVTDGIAQALDYDRIASLVRGTDPAEAARALVLSAQDHGASDDITALVLGAEVATSARQV